MRLFFLTGLLVLTGSLLATALPIPKILLTGTVMADGDAPLEYATVSAFADSLLMDGTVTDAAGKFELDLARGTYRLRIEFIGFAAQEKTVELTGKTDIGAIILTTGGVDLDAVEVRAQRSTMSLRLDKKVFNVGEDILSASGSANEVLEQIPSVTVSADGTVALRGDAGVRILINGRPSALADRGGLSAIPAGSIERVEVITNPSSKYESSGTAGILNVILKQENNRGYGGNVSVSVGAPEEYTANVNLNFRGEKFNAFANVGGRYSDFFGTGFLRRETSLDGSTSFLEQTTDQQRNDLAGSGFFGLDYNLSDRDVLSASYSLFHMRNDDESAVDFTFSSVPSTAPAFAPEQALRQATDYLEPGTYQQTDLTFTRQYGEDQALNIYFKNDRWREPEYEDVALRQSIPTDEEAFRYRTVSDEASNDYMLQADYEMPLGKQSGLEIGARAETRIITSDYSAELASGGEFAAIPGLTNDFDYFERIGAIYAQYKFQADKFGIQLGLRGEATSVRTEDLLESTPELNKDYINLFPTASISYKINEQTSSQLSYGRRIRRPSFWMLNPFGGIGSPTSLFRGNPDIDPIYINRVEWNLLFRTDKITINPAVYASRVTDYFKSIYELDPVNIFGLEDGTVTAMPVNLGNEDLLGLEMVVNYNASEAFTLSAEANYFGFRESGMVEGRDFAATGGSWSGSLRGQLRLPKDISVSAVYFYNAPRTDAQETVRSSYGLNFGVSKKWNDKYTISANGRSPRFRNTEAFRPSFRETEEFEWTGWRGSLTFRYRFEKGASAGERRMRGSIR